MWHRRRTRLLRRLVLGFAVALVAVPVAQAYPDEGSLYKAPAQGRLLVQGEVKDGLGASPSGAVIIIGDDKRGVGASPSGAVMAAETPQVVSSPSDDFHWGDAGIGAAIAAVILLGAGVLLGTRLIGRPAQA